MTKARRIKRGKQRQKEKEEKWGRSEDGQARLLRYTKTYVWALRRSKSEIEELIKNGNVMEKYPVGAHTVEQAIAQLDQDYHLFETSVSKTDLLALDEALKAHKAELAKEMVFKTSTVKQKSWWEKVKYFFYKIFRKTN